MNRSATGLLAVVILSVTAAAQIGSTASAGAQQPAVRGQLPEGWAVPDPGAGSVPKA
jgi:hypothetical protein